MGIMDMFSKVSGTMSKMNLATGGQDPNALIFSSIEKLGLKVASQEGAVTKLAGNYKGRDAAMVVDASAVMGAGDSSMWDMAESVLGDVTGINSLLDNRHWSDQWRSFRAKDRMQRAQMKWMWSLLIKSPVAGSVNIGKESDVGEALGNGLFVHGEGRCREVLNNPDIRSILEKVPFDEITVQGTSCTAFWGPPMSEYQKVVSSPDAVAKTVDIVLDALSKLCDSISGSSG